MAVTFEQSLGQKESDHPNYFNPKGLSFRSLFSAGSKRSKASNESSKSFSSSSCLEKADNDVASLQPVLRKMWFPSFPDQDMEASFIKDEVNHPFRQRACIAAAILLAFSLGAGAQRMYSTQHSLQNVGLYSVWSLQGLVVMSYLLLRLIPPSWLHQDTAQSLWGLVLFSSLLWTDERRLGVAIAGDGRHFSRASDSDEVLLLAMVTGVLLSTNLLPFRSSRATVILIFAPAYVISSVAPGMASVDFGFLTVWQLFGVTCIAWLGRRNAEIGSRLEWLRCSSLADEVQQKEEELYVRQLSAEGRSQLASDQLRREEIEEVMESLKAAIAEGDDDSFFTASQSLLEYMSEDEVSSYVKYEEQVQSEEGGICVAYPLSDAFLEMARERTRKGNPTFYELKDVCFFGKDAIGRDIRCPRDGELGCSFLDALPRNNRRKCTHFLSWTWAYSVHLFRSSLSAWIEQCQLDPNAIFLYCCFFVNNQYRILVEQTANGSDNLGIIFERRLRDIGQMVAMLDTWRRPVYLSRVWTIFEQACAARIPVPVTMLLPPGASTSLIEKLETGKEGIEEVRSELLLIDAENARAFREVDEKTVKDHIKNSLGFATVNKAVARSMMTWIGEVVRDHFHKLTETDTNMEFTFCFTEFERTSRPAAGVHNARSLMNFFRRQGDDNDDDQTDDDVPARGSQNDEVGHDDASCSTKLWI